MVKSEPMALATVLGCVGNDRLRPDASAFGSWWSEYSPSHPEAPIKLSEAGTLFRSGA